MHIGASRAAFETARVSPLIAKNATQASLSRHFYFIINEPESAA